MKRIINLCCIIIGLICIGAGSLGIILPILPTAPFLILAAICFAKGSKRFQQWFEKTSLYRNYVIPAVEKKEMDKRTKFRTLFVLGLIFFISILFVPIWWVKLLIFVVAAIHFYYFVCRVKTISSVQNIGTL